MSRLLGRTLVLLVGLGLLGLGTWVVQQGSSSNPKSTPDVAWSPPITVAAGSGTRGPWRMNDSDWRFVDDPTVALTHDGTAGVVWTNHVHQDLFFQAYAADGTPQLEAPVNVSRSPAVFSWLPRMAFAGSTRDTVYVLWQEIIFSGGTHGGDILFARSTDGGRSFESPLNLSESEAGDGKGRLTRNRWDNGSLDLTVGPEGTVYAAWTTYEGRLWMCKSTTDGASFSAPHAVAGSNDVPARAPALAVGPTGRLHLAWTVGEVPDADIRYARVDALTEGGAPRRVAPSDGYADAPKLATDAGGTVHLAYSEYPSTDDADARVQYTQIASDSIAAPRTLSRPDAERYDRAAFPHLRTAPSGHVYLVWELFRSDQRRPHALGYTVSRDGGTSFARPRILPNSKAPAQGSNGSQQGLLMEKLAVNRAGELAVVNSLLRPGDTSRVQLYRGTTPTR